MTKVYHSEIQGTLKHYLHPVRELQPCSTVQGIRTWEVCYPEESQALDSHKFATFPLTLSKWILLYILLNAGTSSQFQTLSCFSQQKFCATFVSPMPVHTSLGTPISMPVACLCTNFSKKIGRMNTQGDTREKSTNGKTSRMFGRFTNSR